MHFILQSDNLSKDIQRLKSFTAKKIINFLQRHESVKIAILKTMKKNKLMLILLVK
jgi:hypothetical protein